MSLAERWDNSDIMELKGFPWELVPTVSRAPKPVVAGQDAVQVPLAPKVQEGETKKMKLYVLKADVEKY